MKKIIVILCVALALLTAVMSPLQLAAGSKQKYLSDIVLAYGEAERDALVKEGYSSFSKNVNEGNSKSVYICYTVTYDAGEAIRDISVMAMDGNYSTAKYEEILESRRTSVNELVASFKAAINEFARNYKLRLQCGLSAYSILNRFVDPDSGKLLGDLFIDSATTDEQLQTIFLQANTNLLTVIESAIALGCSRSVKGATFIEKLAEKKLDGNYDEALYNTNATVYKQVLIAANSISTYEEHLASAAQLALDSGRIDKLSDYTDKMLCNDIAYDTYKVSSSTANTVLDGCALASNAKQIQYADTDMTLYDLFMMDMSEMTEEDKCYYLNPLSDALSAGQVGVLSMLNISVLIEQSVSSNETIEESITDGLLNMNDVTEDAVSIYLAVDRTIFTADGIALTTDSATQTYANENYDWVDGPAQAAKNEQIDDAELALKISKYAMIAVACWIGFWAITWTVYFMVVEKSLMAGIMAISYLLGGLVGTITAGREGISAFTITMATISNSYVAYALFAAALLLCIGALIARAALRSLRDKLDKQSAVVSYTYKEIPRIIVDYVDGIDNDNGSDGDYVFYYCAKTADGSLGDLNGWDNTTNKYWNALYYTKDVRAGEPMLANVVFGNNYDAHKGYTAVHDFAKGVEGVKSAVNLNQSSRAQDNVITMYVRTAKTSNTGSVFSNAGNIGITAGIAIVCSAVTGAAVYFAMKKREHKCES